MNRRQATSIVLLLLFTADLVSGSNRPGSGGGCDGAGPTLGIGGSGPPGSGGPPGLGGGGPPPTGGADPNTRRFLRAVAKPATKRYLQALTVDVESCCTGNGDFDHLMRDLDVTGQAIATEAEGFKRIPGDSRWSCRRECRDPANGFLGNLAACYEACNCRQNCPTSIDYLTTQCKATCASFALETLESDLCLENCYSQCGERCRSTLNGYIVPLDVYDLGLDILDCYYGVLKGDPAASCARGQQFWESEGYSCTVTEGSDFDCDCDDPGRCLSLVYPCDYESVCVAGQSNNAASPVVSTPSGGKGKSGKSYDYDDDSSSSSSRRNRRTRRTRDRRVSN